MYLKKIITGLLMVFAGIALQAQTYNNEWIDYSKTYYKFKVGATGLYRINQSVLATAGLNNVPVENFRLIRNGKQVPVYTSVNAGSLPANGYIEFWGEQNDGKPDKALYKNAANHLADKFSLQTDTAAYFLVNTGSASGNLRLNETANNVSGNTLPAEPYFIHSLRKDFKDQIHRGKAVYFGEYVYSSTYDVGEFWSSADVYPSSNSGGTPAVFNNALTYAAASGPTPLLNVAVAGSSILGGSRRVGVSINGVEKINQSLGNFDAVLLTTSNITLSEIATTADIRVSNLNNAQPNDRMVVGYIELQYPRTFNFGNATNFEFKLPASAQGTYLEITNFNAGSATPVLYDVTNGKRYTAVNNAGVLRFALQASSTERILVLVSQDASNIKQVNNLESKTFINYASTANQGNYIIISNKFLTGTGTAVQNYQAYRNSAAGGSYNTIICDADELIDQFAFGIKKHPLGIKNFLRWARQNFSTSVKPKYVLLIGKAVVYNEYRAMESNPIMERQNLVPTFGWPASDVLLASDNYLPVAATPIGRLSVISNQEVSDYLDKLKAYEQQQTGNCATIADRSWMKNVVHVAGGNSPSLDYTIDLYFNNYENIIRDTSYGAKIQRFSKSTTGPVSLITDALMEQKLNEGVSIINYFGHSSATALDYALNTPASYNNVGKYPVFIVNGCNAGNNFSFDPTRFNNLTSLAETWVLAKNKGCIAFLASSHFGVTNYLDALNTTLYRSIAQSGYNQSISQNIKDVDQYLVNLGSTLSDPTAYNLHAEENILNGDPAIKVNAFAAPDYAVEESKIVINPSIVSVAENTFKVKAYIYNLGKAVGKIQDSIKVNIKRRYPNGQEETVLETSLKPPVRFLDSVEVTLPIIATRDKGENKITVTIDTDNKYNELCETNNTAEKVFVVIENEIKPVYPYNFSIASTPVTKFYASTANPVLGMSEYRMELDTTELFNSAFKKTYTVTSMGGAIEFNAAGLNFTDSTVYYWRTAIVQPNTNLNWNTASFVYLNNGGQGFGEKHYYQYKKNDLKYITFSDDQVFKYETANLPISIQHGNYPPSDYVNSFVRVKNNTVANWSGSPWPFGSLDFVALNGKTLDPLINNAPSTAPNGMWGSFNNNTREKQFGYYFRTAADRNLAAAFIDSVPNGYYVIIYNMMVNMPMFQYPYVDEWKTDPGPNSLYNKFKQHGLDKIDSFTFKRPFIFVFKKNDPSFTPIQILGQQEADLLSTSFNVNAFLIDGEMKTPPFGPAAEWQQLQWKGIAQDPVLRDRTSVQVYGVRANGQEQLLAHVYNMADTTLSFIDAKVYPFVRLKMFNKDSVYATPNQLKYWFVKGKYLPEGALAANVLYTLKDTIELGETVDFKIAFKNISATGFADSMKLKMVITDNSNVPHVINLPKAKKLLSGDTLVVSYKFDSKDYLGNNTMYVFVNPEGELPEFSLSNNYFYKNFVVMDDKFKPTLDVTFDGVHILNNDIVAAKPNIVIKLKDESKYNLLADTSLVTVQLLYYNSNTGQQSMRRYAYGTDTLQFHPATPGGADNTASVEFRPYLLEDGDYELWVKAKDRNGNPAGDVGYRVAFRAYNKSMISNVFNYPNPFTTSTAFVFTITGSEVPQNMRIQIMTITGKIVKEITKDELGPLHVGRNITEYKWDGTDQYGNKLANGVYLYRVITNNNGNSLEKFQTVDANGDRVNTDQYFKGGYGKMYLMR